MRRLLIFLWIILIFQLNVMPSFAQDSRYKEKATIKIFGVLKWKTKAVCDCISGDCYNQKSEMTFGDNCEHTFIGYMEHGNLIRGKYIWNNGKSTYDGELKKGIPDGRGTMEKEDGTIIVGSFKNGTVAGKAKITHNDKSIQEGYFDENSKLQGFGIYYIGDGRNAGTKYDGNFVDSKFEGFGEINFKVNSNVEQGESLSSDEENCVMSWESRSSEDRYIGEWGECNFSGYGVFYSKNTIKSGYWNRFNNEVKEMTEEEVIQLLNSKYGKNFIAQTPKKLEDIKNKEIENTNHLKNRFDAPDLRPMIDSALSIKPGVEIIDSTNTYGKIEKYLKITWQLDTINKNIIIKKGVIGNYPSGSYLLEDSPNARALLQSIHNCILLPEIINYVKQTNDIRVRIFATSDKPKPNQKYKGEYGQDISGRYEIASKDSSIIGQRYFAKDLKNGFPINNNNILAYIRAYGAKNYLSTEIPELPQEKVKYHIVTKEFNDQIGNDYRKLSIEMTIKLPEKKEIDNTPGKLVDRIKYSDSIPNGFSDFNQAIIISNYSYKYKDTLETGKADGELMNLYFRKCFGLKDEQIKYMPNLSSSVLNDFFNLELGDLVENKNLVIYISAHGTTDKDKNPVIQGVDAKYSHNGILVDSIYSILSKLENKYKSALVIFDCCYTTEGKADPFSEEIIKPMFLCKKTVFIHAASSSISKIYQDKGQSLFTYFLCKSIFDSKVNENLTIRQLFQNTKINVLNKSGDFHQKPCIYPLDEENNKILDKIIINYKK